MTRMTWIKPSFNWMMYRAGFARKPGQKHILAVDILRSGFTWALQNAVLSDYFPSVHASHKAWRQELVAKCVRVQWDPERDDKLRALPSTRTIQVGLSGEAVRRYVNDWTVRITDVTEAAHAHGDAAEGNSILADPISRHERPYPYDADAMRHIVPVFARLSLLTDGVPRRGHGCRGR